MTTQRPMRFNNCDYNGLAHEWAYNHERDLRTGCDRMHTRGNTLYSYSTAIAYKIVDKQVLLMSRYKYSVTTNKQMYKLWSAFSHWNIIEVGSKNIPECDEALDRLLKREVKECIERLKDMLKNIKKNKQGVFARYEDRKEFCGYVRTLNELSRYVNHSLYNTKTKMNKFLLEYEQKLNAYDSEMVERREQLRKERREQLRKERERKAREEYLKRNEALITALDNFKKSGATSFKEYSAILNKYMVNLCGIKDCMESFFNLNTVEDYHKCYSFIWRAGDVVKTTQGIVVPWSDVELLLKLWKAGKPILGKRAGQYTVLSVNDDYVQVGCHRIPVVNLNAIYEEEN